MPHGARRHRYSYGDYLSLEEIANVRHEYLDGEIYAMAGGSPEHAELAGNVLAELKRQLRDEPSHVYPSDLRIRVRESGLTTYPDVTVVCGPIERDSENSNTVLNPVVVVEVLSPSTQDYDRGEKLDSYKTIPSLRHAVLVSSDREQIETWSQSDGGIWAHRSSRGGDILALDAIDCRIAVHEIYRGVELVRV